jgi:excisionase family DNA binding protein
MNKANSSSSTDENEAFDDVVADAGPIPPGRKAVKKMNETFDHLPLLLAVPQAATLLGISRASAYRLVAAGELPARRLGGRVYVVTARLRDLVAS